MTTEREYLGNPAPEPAKTWDQALDQANAYFIEAAYHSANGNNTQALAAGAMGVGLAAESRHLEDQAAEDNEAENIVAFGGDMVRRDRPLSDDEVEAMLMADPRLSRWDVLDGVGRRPLPGQVDALDELGRFPR